MLDTSWKRGLRNKRGEYKSGSGVLDRGEGWDISVNTERQRGDGWSKSRRKMVGAWSRDFNEERLSTLSLGDILNKGPGM